MAINRGEERAFSKGDRIQFTAPANELRVANRALGTVEGIVEGRMAYAWTAAVPFRSTLESIHTVDHG